MKKMLLLLLVSANCLGNTYVKETGFRKILCFFCPCLRKKTSQATGQNIKRVISYKDLDMDDYTPRQANRTENYLNDAYKIRKSRNGFTVPAKN